MKRIVQLMLVCAIAGALMCSCSSVPRSYEDLNEIPGVENVYIGPGMMSMANSLASVVLDKVPGFSSISKNLTSLRVVMVDEPKAINRVRPFFRKQIKSIKAQSMFNTNMGNGEQFSLYATPSTSSPDRYSDVMLISDSGEYMFVVVATGSFTSGQLRSIK